MPEYTLRKRLVKLGTFAARLFARAVGRYARRMRIESGRITVVCADAWRERLETDGFLDFAAVMARQDGEAAKTRLSERQVHRFALADGSVVYLKRYFEIGVLDALKHRFEPTGCGSPAAREWTALMRLKQIGVPSIEPLAYAEERRGGLVRRCYVVTLALPEGITLEETADPVFEPPFDAEVDSLKRYLIVQAGRLVAAMHRGGVNHRDLYLGHLWLTFKLGGAFELRLLDLNRADVRPEVSDRWVVKDLAALSFSAAPRLFSFRDRVRFLRAYGWSKQEIRARLGAIRTRAEKMRAHVRRRIAEGRANYHINE